MSLKDYSHTQTEKDFMKGGKLLFHKGVSYPVMGGQMAQCSEQKPALLDENR